MARNYQNVDNAASGDYRQGSGGLHAAEPHHGMVSEYQQSGFPFVFYKSVGAQSGIKMVTITLPYVSRWIRLRLGGTVTAVRVGFGDYTTTKGIQGANYITGTALNEITTPLELKCKKILIWIPAAVDDLVIELIAGLTNIRQFPEIHASGVHSDIVGVNQEAAVTASTTKHGFEAIYTIGDDTATTS
ncbi:MAG TPA: hypothetical protein EYQ69_09510 [Gemmatimonadetes bacterium]|nr:hypothetical protein [Gemmatimonadota bacterium]